MDYGGLDDLVLPAALLLKTTGTVELLGAEIAGTVYRGGVEAIENSIGFEFLASLELMKKVLKDRPQRFRVKFVQRFPHPGIFGNRETQKRAWLVVCLASSIRFWNWSREGSWKNIMAKALMTTS